MKTNLWYGLAVSWKGNIQGNLLKKIVFTGFFSSQNSVTKINESRKLSSFGGAMHLVEISICWECQENDAEGRRRRLALSEWTKKGIRNVYHYMSWIQSTVSRFLRTLKSFHVPADSACNYGSERTRIKGENALRTKSFWECYTLPFFTKFGPNVNHGDPRGSFSFEVKNGLWRLGSTTRIKYVRKLLRKRYARTIQCVHVERFS